MILRAPNTDRLIDGKPRTVLTAVQASGSSTVTTESIADFAIGNRGILGILGEERSEVVRVHISTAPSGSTITLNANTGYRHEIGTPLYFVDYDSVEFSHAATAAGAKTVLTTKTLVPDQMDTLYDDFANSTGFGFYRFYVQSTISALTSVTTTATATSAGHGFVTGQSVVISGATQAEYNGTYTITVTNANTFTYTFAGSGTSPATGTILATRYADYSDAIPYAGYDIDAVSTIIDRALSMTSTKVNPRLKYENLFSFLNEAITIANAKNTRWAEAKVLSHELDTISTGDWEWALPTNIARLNDPSAVIALYVRGYPPMKYKPQREFNQYLRDIIFTTLTTTIEVGYLTIVLNNSKGFADSGTIYIEGDAISYTANDRTTNTLSGVTGITATHTGGSTTYVLQNFTSGEPVMYTITSEGRVRAWPVCTSTINNRVLYMDYFRRIPTVDSLGDLILISNVTAFVEYVAYRIKKHLAGGTLALTDEEYRKFTAAMEECVTRDTAGEPIRVRTK